MTLFETVFSGNDAVYGLTEGAINAAIEQHGADKAISFPNTAYSLPCYYAVTGVKVNTLGELKEALGVVKTLMTREMRTHDIFMSGVATALCAEFIEVLKYIDGATPYEEPCYGHLADAVIRELGYQLLSCGRKYVLLENLQLRFRFYRRILYEHKQLSLLHKRNLRLFLSIRMEGRHAEPAYGLHRCPDNSEAGL